MNQKENISPLSMANNENALINIKETTSTKEPLKTVTSQQQQAGLKNTVNKSMKKSENTTIATEKTAAQVKKNFLDANTVTSPVSTQLKNNTSPIIVHKETTEQLRRSASPPTNHDKPLLLRTQVREHIHIHHKPVKPLLHPIELKTKKEEEDQDKEIENLKKKLKDVEQQKTERSAKLNQIKKEKKIADEKKKQLKNELASYEEIEASITSIKEEQEESKATIAELFEMMSGFSDNFKLKAEGYNETMEMKEEQIQALLNTLSEIKYKISEIDEE